MHLWRLDAKQGAGWNTWEPEIAHRQPEALDQWQQRLSAEIYYYIQFEFFRQWSELKRYANMHIQIIGDIPIYVAHDSAVWDIRKSLPGSKQAAALMAGVPPTTSAPLVLWGNSL